jgi:hypothetical protein
LSLLGGRLGHFHGAVERVQTFVVPRVVHIEATAGVAVRCRWCALQGAALRLSPPDHATRCRRRRRVKPWQWREGGRKISRGALWLAAGWTRRCGVLRVGCLVGNKRACLLS